MSVTVGTTILHDGTGTTPFYSRQFGRGGLAAVFVVNVTHITSSTTLVVRVEHRNREEATWTTAGTFANITDIGDESVDVTDCKELLRLAFTFSAGSAGKFVHLIAPRPAWRPFS